MNNYQDYEVEREIDIKDLCFSLLKKWKTILIGTIVICVLLCGYGLFKNKKSNSASDPKEALTDEEIENVENAYASYEQALKSRDIILSKVNNSAIAQISPDDAVGRMISYIIESDVDNIYSYYKSINVFTADEKKEIIEACNFDEDTNNLDDLVSVNGKESEYIAGVSDNTKMKTTMTVYIYANSDSACDTIESILENHIEGKNATTGSTCSNLETVDDIETDFVSDTQTNLSNSLTDINNKIYNLVNITYLSDDELTYYTSLIEGTEDEETTTSFNWKKYGVVGVAGGLFVMCFIYAMIYVLSDKVHATDDFKAYGVDSVGTLDYSKDDVSKEMWLVSSIISFMKLHELTKLYISLDYKNEKIDNTLNIFTSELKKQGIDTVIGDPLTNSESFNELTSSEAVVLFETAEQSKYDSVGKIIDLAKRQNIRLVGSIVGKM
jgi:hypothetical protein